MLAGTLQTEWRYQMSRWQIVRERVWVGTGAGLFALVLIWKGFDTDSLLVLLAGIAVAICGALILFGQIRPPYTNDNT